MAKSFMFQYRNPSDKLHELRYIVIQEDDSISAMQSFKDRFPTAIDFKILN